jgi:hypothetical protein
MTKRIPPKASIYTELTRERAEKLATLRRGRFDEFMWASITGFVASIPSAIHSGSLVMSRNASSIEFPEAIDFGITLIFAVLVAVASFSWKNRGLTSIEYLETHFGQDPDASPRRSSWWFG